MLEVGDSLFELLDDDGDGVIATAPELSTSSCFPTSSAAPLLSPALCLLGGAQAAGSANRQSSLSLGHGQTGGAALSVVVSWKPMHSERGGLVVPGTGSISDEEIELWLTRSNCGLMDEFKTRCSHAVGIP